MKLVPDALYGSLRQTIGPRRTGRVTALVGLRVEVEGVQAAVGDGVRIFTGRGVLDGEVVAVQGSRLACMPLGELTGIRYGDPVEALGRPFSIRAGNGLMGRVVDGLGRPIDDGPPLEDWEEVDLHGAAPHPLRRDLVDQPLGLGVRALDTLVPCGRGQRLGIMAGSGVGKSSLLSMLTRGTEASVAILALVGERGREVNEFIQRDLGPQGLARAVVVVATSDEPALVRIKAAFTATRLAEWFRDQGQDVLLMMDSLTRFAMAQREVGLSAGEPPATRGYPPSVFSLLPKLLERAGTAETGSITGLYTVLVEADDLNDPVADATRSILDGHIVLSRRLATSGHFPSIDVLESISRVETAVTSRAQAGLAREARRLLAAYRDAQDLIEIGAYRAGADPVVDRSVALREPLNRFLRQDLRETFSAREAWAVLARTMGVDPAEVVPA